MKECKKCNERKAYSEYYKNKTNLDGYQTLCKSCTKDKNRDNHRQRYQKHKDGLHHVYVSGKYNYAGITDNPKWRKTNHAGQGRPDIDMRIIYSTTNRKDALELEEFLHDLGYEGRGKGIYQ